MVITTYTKKFAISITSRKILQKKTSHASLAYFPSIPTRTKVTQWNMHLNNWCSQKSSSYVWNENKNLCIFCTKKWSWLCWSYKSFMLTPSHIYISKYYFHWTDKHAKILKIHEIGVKKPQNIFKYIWVEKKVSFDDLFFEVFELVEFLLCCMHFMFDLLSKLSGFKINVYQTTQSIVCSIDQCMKNSFSPTSLDSLCSSCLHPCMCT